MMITKCDICRKTVPERGGVYIGVGRWLPNRSLCNTCGKPVLTFLARHHLAADGSVGRTKPNHGKGK